MHRRLPPLPSLPPRPHLRPKAASTANPLLKLKRLPHVTAFLDEKSTRKNYGLYLYFFVQGDRVRAARSLGRALHYVQDKSLSKGFLGLSHGSREDEAALQKVSLRSNQRRNFVSGLLSHYVEKVIREVMREACWASAAIAKAVFGMRDPPKELPSALRHAKERYWKRTIPLAATASIAFLLAAAITRNLLLALGVLSGYVIQLLDRKYHYLKKEAKWFGIS